MTTEHVTVLGFAGIGAAFVTLHLLGRRPRSEIPTAGQCLGYLMRPAVGRVAVLLGWWWLGWHFFAR